MNLISGKVYWDIPINNLNVQVDKNIFNNGKIYIETKRIPIFEFAQDAVFFDHKRRIACSIIGYITSLQDIKDRYRITAKNDVEIIAELYSLRKLEISSDLEGVFKIVIFDGDDNKMYVISDDYGSYLPFYYIVHDKGLSFSTSLKKLLENSPDFKREINFNSVYGFLGQNLIADDSTLIKNVKKINPGKIASIDFTLRSIYIKDVHHDKKQKIDSLSPEQYLIPSIEKQVEVLYNYLMNKNVAVTLSGGFDTNILLHILHNLNKDEICAFSIGGAKINEVETAKLIVNQYSKVKHTTSIISAQRADVLPDIVWRNEGSVFEEGLFLQYELAKLLEQARVSSVFLGECADQILDQTRGCLSVRIISMFKERIKLTLFGRLLYYLLKGKLPGFHPKSHNVLKPFKRFRPRAYFDVEIDYILKKGGIILNSFGIQPLYPFLNHRTKLISEILGFKNYKKRIYKNLVCQRLKPEIGGLLKKIGGATDVDYIFLENKEVIMGIFQQPLVKKILSPTQIKRIYNDPNRYIKLIFQLCFVYIFNELFITGLYDNRFKEPGIDVSLQDLI